MLSVSCRFAVVLPILTFFSILALAQGTLPSQTLLLPPGGSVGQGDFFVNVRPGEGVGAPAPRGSVALYEGTTAVGSPAILSPGTGFRSAPFAEFFGTPDPALPATASDSVTADFNEDGVWDVLVYGTGSQPGLVVQTFLHILPPALDVPPSFAPIAAQQLALPLQMQAGQRLAVLDVDGDGHLDLLAGNTVAYGNGDGTFGRVAVLPALATGYNQTYALDMDGDGTYDIVAVNTPPSTLAPGTVQYEFTVFHNDGVGRFTAMGPYPLAPSFAAGSSVFYNIFGLSFFDLNGDGRMDVISQSNAVPVGNAAEPAALNVMLNLGTGYSAPKSIDTSSILDEGIVTTYFTDLNEDGKQDLVFSYQANTMNNGVVTLLGNGDGTFAAPIDFTIGSTHAIGSPLLPLTADDVTADGKPDVVLGNGVLLQGNGDGTLTPGTPFFTSTTGAGVPPAYEVFVLPGIGIQQGGQLVFLNLQPGANAYFTLNEGSVATLTPMLSPGTHSLTALYFGDSNFAGSRSNTINVTIPASTPTIAITSSANPVYASQSITFTATLNDPTITGSIIFADISPNDDNALDPMAGSTESTLGTATISNGVATLTAKLPVGGTHTIIAVYGPNIYAPIAQAQLKEMVNIPFAVNSSNKQISLTASRGQSATVTIPIRALGGFTGQVALACVNGTPTPMCSFSPATVTLSGTGAVNVTLTVTAVSAESTSAAARQLSGAALACGIPLLALLGVAGRRRRCLLLLLGAAIWLMPFTGCGGGSSSSNSLAAGTYQFLVTATSGQNVQVIGVTLTVQ